MTQRTTAFLDAPLPFLLPPRFPHDVDAKNDRFSERRESRDSAIRGLYGASLVPRFRAYPPFDHVGVRRRWKKRSSGPPLAKKRRKRRAVAKRLVSLRYSQEGRARFARAGGSCRFATRKRAALASLAPEARVASLLARRDGTAFAKGRQKPRRRQEGSLRSGPRKRLAAPFHRSTQKERGHVT